MKILKKFYPQNETFLTQKFANQEILTPKMKRFLTQTFLPYFLTKIDYICLNLTQKRQKNLTQAIFCDFVQISPNVL
jgi:hypothetical protein